MDVFHHLIHKHKYLYCKCSISFEAVLKIMIFWGAEGGGEGVGKSLPINTFNVFKNNQIFPQIFPHFHLNKHFSFSQAAKPEIQLPS